MVKPPSPPGLHNGRCYCPPSHLSSNQSGLPSQAPAYFGVPAQPQAGHHSHPPNHLAYPQHQISLDRYGDPFTHTTYGGPSNNPWSTPQEPFQVRCRDPYQTQPLQHPNAHDDYGEFSSNHIGTPGGSFLTHYQSPYSTQNQKHAQNSSRSAYTDHSNQPEGYFPAQAQHPSQINPFGHTPAPASITNNMDQRKRVLPLHQTLPVGANNRMHPQRNPLHQSAIWQMMQAPPHNPASQNVSKLTNSPATQKWHRRHQMGFCDQINGSRGLQVTASTSLYEQQERAPQKTVPSLTSPYQLKSQIVASGSDHGLHVARVEGPSQVPEKDENASQRSHHDKIPSQHHQPESQDVLNQRHRDTTQKIQNKQHLSTAPKMHNQARIEPLAPPIDFQCQEASIKSPVQLINERHRSSDMASRDLDQTALENFALRPEGDGNVFFTPHSPETLEETYY